jgi:hypothetical protein
MDRKTYLRSLLSRTPAQIAEEDFLFIESRRIEQSYHRLTREREDLLKILGGREGIGATGGVQIGVGGGEKGRSSMGTAGGMGQQPLASGSGEKRKKNATGWEIEGLNGGGLPDGWAGEGGQRKATPSQGIVIRITPMNFFVLTRIETMIVNRYCELYRTTSVPLYISYQSPSLSFRFRPILSYRAT